MKFFPTSFCKTQVIDGFVNHRVLSFFVANDWQRSNLEECDVVVLSFTWTHEYDFDTELFKKVVELKKPIIVLDYLEHRQIMDITVLGHHMAERLIPGAFGPLHAALKESGLIKSYFKRELPAHYADKALFPLYPLDFLHAPPACELQTEENFLKRPIDVLMVWGYSNESRPMLYTELIRNKGRFNAPHFALRIGDVRYLLENKLPCPLALLYQPHYDRLDLSEIYQLQSISKVTISLFGAGNKCFRSAEASFDTIVAHQAPELVQWSYPWIPDHNCIGLPNANSEQIDETGSVNTLLELTQRCKAELYPLYVNCFANGTNYDAKTYTRDYLMPKICASL